MNRPSGGGTGRGGGSINRPSRSPVTRSSGGINPQHDHPSVSMNQPAQGVDLGGQYNQPGYQGSMNQPQGVPTRRRFQRSTPWIVGIVLIACCLIALCLLIVYLVSSGIINLSSFNF
jgi:hypothetical protein